MFSWAPDHSSDPSISTVTSPQPLFRVPGAASMDGVWIGRNDAGRLALALVCTTVLGHRHIPSAFVMDQTCNIPEVPLIARQFLLPTRMNRIIDRCTYASRQLRSLI